MNAIVSVTQDWGIGFDGQLLVRNRADMRRFVDLTMGGTVIMGRRTLESFPGGPLKGRRNIVVSARPDYEPEGVEVARSPEAALALAADEDPDRVWLIGGASVYEALLPRCERAYVTKNACEVTADAWFRDHDDDDPWSVESTEPGGVTEDGVSFEYVTYRHVTRDEAPRKPFIGSLLSHRTARSRRT